MEANEIYQLALDIDEFIYDFDTYGYWDDAGHSAEDREENVQFIADDISHGKTESFKDFFAGVIENDSCADTKEKAQELLDHLTIVSDRTNKPSAS